MDDPGGTRAHLGVAAWQAWLSGVVRPPGGGGGVWSVVPPPTFRTQSTCRRPLCLPGIQAFLPLEVA